MTPEAPKFVLDRELFPLCKTLRMLGFNALSRDDFPLEETVARAIEERRIWVRKDIEAPGLQYGIRYFLVQSDDVPGQLSEIESQYPIRECARLFSRCLKCNELLCEVPLAQVKERVPQRVLIAFQQFYVCPACNRIYWPGSHLQRMKKKLEAWGW